MNFFEEQVAKLSRRVKRIEENPDPTKLRATKMLYELELAQRQGQLEAWKAGHPFMFGLNVPGLVRAMGLEFLDLYQAANRVSDAGKYFEVIRRWGYADHHCDRTVVGVGMVLAGDVPRPTLSVANNGGCDPTMLMGAAIGHHLSPYNFTIDVDRSARQTSGELLSYITSQLQEMIEFARAHIPGAKYDEDKLLELGELDMQGNAYMREIYELRKQVPCPIRGQDVFRIPRQPSVFPDPYKAAEYCRVLRDEIGERAAKGQGAVKEEKLRIMWTITAPYFSDVFRFLEESGASIVHFQTGGAARWWGLRGYIGDEEEFGRKLSPLEEQARLLSFNSWAGPASRWVDDTLRFARDLKVDAIINFEQWGCVAAVLTRKVLADRAEQEVGIPSFFLEGRNLDQTTFDQQTFQETLAGWVDICLSRKGAG